MKIETKFNIGQEVWFAKSSHHIKGIVSEVTVYTSLKSHIIAYGIEAKNYRGFFQEPEQVLFPTKEELLKSL